MVLVEKICWLEAIDGDPVGCVAYLELETFLSSLEDFVGAGVRRHRGANNQAEGGDEDRDFVAV